MLGTVFRTNASKELLDEILKKVQGSDCAQCGKCGSIKISSKILSRILHDIDIDSDLSDDAHEILSGITEGVPKEILDDPSSWMKWDEENDDRRLSFIDSCDGEQYLRFKDVLLITESKCHCFYSDRHIPPAEST